MAMKTKQDSAEEPSLVFQRGHMMVMHGLLGVVAQGIQT
jgi:hypothetical protein